MLNASEYTTLDGIIRFLSSPQPWFPPNEGVLSTWGASHASFHDVVAVCGECLNVVRRAPNVRAAHAGPFSDLSSTNATGNWYDLPDKAASLHTAATILPRADLLLTGGRAERLTPAEAVSLGGEPLMLRQAMIDRYKLDPSRMVLWTGARPFHAAK